MPALTSLSNVKSLKRGDISVADLSALRDRLRGNYPQRAIRIVEERERSGFDVEVYVIDGDLIVPGNLKATHEHAESYTLLVVLGNLTVEGVFVDNMHEPEVITVVAGDMTAVDIVNSGFLEVQGNLSTGSLVGLDNDCSAEIFGDIRATFFWPHYHHFKVHGIATFDTALGRVWGASEVVRQLTVSDALGVLDRELLEFIDTGGGEIEVSCIKQDELADRVASGRSIFA